MHQPRREGLVSAHGTNQLEDRFVEPWTAVVPHADGFCESRATVVRGTLEP
jgi:hypothetical protein